MPKVTEIGISIEEIAARKERLEKTRRFETPDRVAVIPAINSRFLVPMTGVSFRDYYGDPETMLRAQIQAQKWLLEHVRTDACSITGAWVGGWTDFQNTFEAGSLGCQVVFPENDIPWVTGKGWVKSDSDLRRLAQIDPIHTGINARQLEYRDAMMAVAEKYPVRFQGGPVFHPAANPALTHTSDGPFTVAADLMGHTEIFAAILERPEFVRELLSIVTEKILAWLDFCWAEERLTERHFAWTDDLAAYLSRDVFREMVLPFNQKLRFHFDRAALHMCGQTNHLLEIFADELKIDEFQGFGYMLDLDKLKRVMGGRVVLLGNVNPLTIASGTPEQVRAETRRVIEKLAPCRGLILQDGNNIAPGSPLENINAMMAAAEQFGRYA